VPGFHGLGLLAPCERLASQPALAASLAKIDAAGEHAGRIRALEERRLFLLFNTLTPKDQAKANGSARGVARLQERAARLRIPL
jgi:hypothetical protein